MTDGTFWWLVVVSIVLVMLYWFTAGYIGHLEGNVQALQTAVATAAP